MTREGAPALARTRPRPPIRIVHLGLGNFFRAHQAWYTHHASDGEAWGIAAFCGRSAEPAERLNRQDATYTLDIREPSGDRYEVIESIGTAFANADRQAWARCWADPAVVLATMTITEAGYCRTPDGRLQHADPRIQQDIAALGQGHGERTVTAPGQLVAGLMAPAAGAQARAQD